MTNNIKQKKDNSKQKLLAHLLLQGGYISEKTAKRMRYAPEPIKGVKKMLLDLIDIIGYDDKQEYEILSRKIFKLKIKFGIEEL